MRKFALLAVLMAATAALAPAPVSAAGPLQSFKPGVTAGHGLVQEAQYFRRRCHRWRRICAHRWGWGTRRFYRCMFWHGC